MNIFRASATTVGLALVVAYAIASGLWVSSATAWYQSLKSPSWQPPDWVFGVIWPYNFIILALAAVLIGQRLNKTSTLEWLAFLLLSVVAALTWAYLFYQPHKLGAAAVSLVAAALLTLPVVIIAFTASRPIGVALIPYQIWLVIAASLSVQYARLN